MFDKLGGGRRNRYSTTNGKDVWLRLPLLAAVMMAVSALPPQTNRLRITKKKARGKNTRNSASCKDAELDCVLSTFTYLKYEALRGV